MYADDLCFVAESAEGLQQLVSNLHEQCCRFGLKISVKKTEVMSLDSHGHEDLTITLGEDVLTQVDKFRYLGSTITSKLRATTKVSYAHIQDIMYADDLCFVAESAEGLQQLVSNLHEQCCRFGLKISVKKTEVMSLDSHGHEDLTITLGEDVLTQMYGTCIERFFM
uniref:Reverse transcriptase domain-containing protein n=1 Tax=Heliothis virescens TaxID=7102 RepID=A0A2A4JU22_HELVI